MLYSPLPLKIGAVFVTRIWVAGSLSIGEKTPTHAPEVTPDLEGSKVQLLVADE